MVRAFYRAAVVSLLSLFVCMSFVQAQTASDSSVGFSLPTTKLDGTTPDTASITLNASNNHPHPFQNVDFNVQSYSVDLSRSTITWNVAGKSAASGIGQVNFSYSVGGIGSSQTISVTIKTPNGILYTKSQKLTVATVDVLWQAQSYTPLFYKGKALLPNQGDVSIVAIPNFSPNGSKSDATNYVYTWKENGQVLGDVSGYGQNAITIPGSIIVKPLNISVEVRSQDGSVVSTGNTVIQSRSPKIVLYADNSLYGTVYNHVIEPIYTLTAQEIHMRAIPYFFSTQDPHSTLPLSFEWKLNNDVVSQKTSNDLILRQPNAKTVGQSNISVSTSLSDRILQTATDGTTISFTTKN